MIDRRRAAIDPSEPHAVTATRPTEGFAPNGSQYRSAADTDPYGALAALRRAALRARQVALQTGTDLILMRAGQIVRVSPQQKPDP